MRGDNCAGPGTYDGETGQVGSRDAEIDESPLSCVPHVCDDGACNGPEDCTTCPSDYGQCPYMSDNDCQPNMCYPTDCIPIWVPQGRPFPTCDDGGGYITCVCQNGVCTGVF